MLNKAKSIFHFTVTFWNFDPEWVSNFDSECRTRVLHASEAVVCTIEALRQTVHEAPLLIGEIRGLSVFNFATRVVIPKDLLAFAVSPRKQRRRVQDLALNSVFLDAQVDLEFPELLRVLDVFQERVNSLEAIGGIADLVVL